MAPKNPRNIIFFLHYQINANGKNNHVFFDVSKINVDVHTCYLTEKYHHKNRDTLKYKKKVGTSLITQIKIWIYWYIFVQISTLHVNTVYCEEISLSQKTKSITERVSGSEKPVYGPSGLHNGQFVYVPDPWLFR